MRDGSAQGLEGLSHLGAGVRFYGDVELGPGSVLEDYCVIGKPTMYDLDDLRHGRVPDGAGERLTRIGPRTVLGTGTKVYVGSVLGEEVETEDDVRIGWHATIGARTRLMYRAQVYCGVTIGEDCRIAGFVGDNVTVADRVAFFGSAVHDYPYRTSTYEPRPSASIGADVIVCTNAVIVGGVTIGERAYVAANAVVTRDVPADHVCFAANEIVHRDSWPGRLGRLD